MGVFNKKRIWKPYESRLRDSESLLKTEEELNFSMASQAGMLSRRFYKKYGIDFERLKSLMNIYLVYIEKEVIVSKITIEQVELLEKISVKMEYK